jgi:hypothetical protein
VRLAERWRAFTWRSGVGVPPTGDLVEAADPEEPFSRDFFAVLAR